MDHWTLFLLFGILLVLGVITVLFDSLIIGLFLRVFLALALRPPGYSFLGSLHARLLASLPMFLGLKHAQLSKVNIFLYYYIIVTMVFQLVETLCGAINASQNPYKLM